jgi:hypothetical protein
MADGLGEKGGMKDQFVSGVQIAPPEEREKEDSPISKSNTNSGFSKKSRVLE